MHCLIMYWPTDNSDILRLDCQLCISNPVHGEVYSIQYYVINFASDLRQVGGFLRVFPFPPSIKIDSHDITEILLKVTLNTINQINFCSFIGLQKRLQKNSFYVKPTKDYIQFFNASNIVSMFFFLFTL